MIILCSAHRLREFIVAKIGNWHTVGAEKQLGLKEALLALCRWEIFGIGDLEPKVQDLTSVSDLIESSSDESDDQDEEKTDQG